MAQELFKKYAQERDKRNRPEGLAQYIDVRSKEIKDLAKDPWVDYASPSVKNPPLKHGSSIKFLICGGGHSGILYAYRLIEAGFSSKDIVIVDIAGGFGGTWYWNRYPGLMCDVEGFVYLPLLEETGYIPKHKYSYGEEIRGQSERIAAKWGLQGQFCTKIDCQTWDEHRHQWVVKMTRTLGKGVKHEDLTVYADFVVGAGGVLSIPKIPKLTGWPEFRAKKHAFHTSRWDYAYTGGTQEKPDMIHLKSKRVALIGTGATAVQAVPELAKWAEHLYVVQRTPSYCGLRVSGTIGSSSKIVSPNEIGEHIEELLRTDSVATEELRARISREVKDQETAEKLKPWYGTWCKRPTFHDDYLPTFNRENVTLIDTNGKGLERLTENGIVFDGVEYEVDCLVLATGFVVGGSNDPSQRVDAPIIGRNEISMTTKWEEPGSTTAFGVFLPGFPNFAATFYRGGGFSYNLSSVYDVFARLFAHVMATAHSQASFNQKLVIDVSEQALGRWAGEVAKRAAWFTPLSICTPGYYTSEGTMFSKEASAKADIDKESFSKARQALWGSGPVDYQLTIEKYMAKEGSVLEDFVVEMI
ncbi:cyclohexanone 1-2-monooxygenase [Diaporthe amygdali]|uniref:cyclohexanone 1-2-monooxygenase n=1 Tax=Phomopsis amygdali TaxID=1214568 RepID=UPI0022FECE9E|nr:cyclohexanone 1-2-monooxygenase [Diaporthe amygdali]KAJ0121625.1 cyclohexanone 1-2-monooxygenase [Diaporthe amygdali]